MKHISGYMTVTQQGQNRVITPTVIYSDVTGMETLATVFTSLSNGGAGAWEIPTEIYNAYNFFGHNCKRAGGVINVWEEDQQVLFGKNLINGVFFFEWKFYEK